jgi:hypothetical protein
MLAMTLQREVLEILLQAAFLAAKSQAPLATQKDIVG